RTLGQLQPDPAQSRDWGQTYRCPPAIIGYPLCLATVIELEHDVDIPEKKTHARITDTHGVPSHPLFARQMLLDSEGITTFDGEFRFRKRVACQPGHRSYAIRVGL